MARRTKADAEATRLEILNAAEKCFIRDGVFRTTLEQIAESAGYTRGAVYWHFKNKLDVLEALMERVELPIFAGLDALPKSQDQPLRALRRFYADAFGLLSRDSRARNVLEILHLRCEFVEETKRIVAHQQRATTVALSRITEVLRRAQSLRLLRAGVDPATCAIAIHFLILGVLREWALDPQTVSLKRHGLAALDVLFSGIAAEDLDPATGERGASVARRQRVSSERTSIRAEKSRTGRSK
jgi:TetR/AcrR family acrAB operon transcriptional repressor